MQTINLTSVSFSILKTYADAKNLQIEGDRRQKQSYIDSIQTYWDGTGITKLIEVTTLNVTKFIANELDGLKEPELIAYGKDTPESFLQQLAKVNDVEDIDLLDTDLLKQIAANPATTYEVIEILNSIFKKNQSYLEAYCHHWDDNYYESLIQELELDFGQNQKIIEKFDSIDLAQFLEDTDSCFFSIIFSLSSLSHQNVLDSIAENTLINYTKNLLQNEKIYPETDNILFVVIHNLNTPLSTLDKLVTTICLNDLYDWWWEGCQEIFEQDTFELIIKQLQANINTFSTTINKLSELKKSLELAENPETSLITLEQLAKHENHQIRLEVASNLTTSIEVLKELLNDPGERIRLAAKNNPTMSEYQGALKLQAADTKTSKNILKKLAKHQNYEVRQEVAKNTTTPTDCLISLAEDDREKVRFAVLNNSKTPAKIKKQIEQQEQKIEEAKQVALNSQTATKKINNLAHHKYWKVREAIAANCSVTKILESLAQDKNIYVRVAVASNSHTTKEILELLKDDSEFIVRESVNTARLSPKPALRRQRRGKLGLLIRVILTRINRRLFLIRAIDIRPTINKRVSYCSPQQSSFIENRREGDR